MKQKLFTVDTFEGEVEFPQELKDLLDTGWRIVQISAYGYQGKYAQERCVLLLEQQ